MGTPPDQRAAPDDRVTSRPVPESVRRPLLMSLRPRFAEAILQGSKTVELRRTRVSAAADTTIIIYASTPVMSVVGVATLAKVDTAAPGTLWRRYRHRLGLTRSEFDDYLAGVDAATCLSITNPRTLDEPLKLADLRAQADFQPPQSYRYLAPHDPDMLHSLTENVQVGPTPLEVGRR